MGWPLGKPRTKSVDSTVSPTDEAVASAVTEAPPHAAVTADPHDKLLDHFQYKATDSEMQVWEKGDVSPLSVPKNIKSKYPGMRWHWVSKSKIDRVGAGYQGWQKFQDSRHPEGVTRGNDLMLAAMPEEKARQYNEFIANQSTEKIKELQMRAAEQNADFGTFTRDSGDKVEGLRGLEIGKSRTSTKQRGYSQEQIQEVIRKNQEKSRKRTLYFT